MALMKQERETEPPLAFVAVLIVVAIGVGLYLVELGGQYGWFR